MNELVTLLTEDGVTIVGDYYEGGGDKAVLLLHMMPATRASWVAFANLLVSEGFSVFAIDLRGHGDSTKGSGETLLNYHDFQDVDHAKSALDVVAAVEYLRKERKMKDISIGGASIGANLALVYAAAHPEIKSVLLLSPGLVYRSIETSSAAENASSSQRAFLVASDDDEYSAASTKELHEKFPGEKRLQIFSDSGHGTTMIERKPEFMKELVTWLQA